MKAIVIDDERLALGLLVDKLTQAGVHVVGAYTDPVEGLESVMRGSPNAVFLDIHMPELTGLELAERVLEHRPDQEVIFVTAYDEHAIRAFELNALDYIVKPVQADRLSVTVQRLQSRLQLAAELAVVDGEAAPVGQSVVTCIRMFGELAFEADGSLVDARWRTGKAQELFAYLLQANAPVHRDTLADALWPDLDAERATALLYTTVYQARQTLRKLPGLVRIVSTGGAYRVEHPNIRVDMLEWLDKWRALAPLTPDSCDDYRAWLHMNPESYLAAYDYAWAEAERQRLDAKWVQYALKVGTLDLDTGNPEAAAVVFGTILKRQPDCEAAHFGLMRANAAQGRRREVEAAYKQLQHMMEEELSHPVDPAIETWYRAWRKTAAGR